MNITPGPWKIDREGDPSWADGPWIVSADGEWLVADLNRDEDDGSENPDTAEGDLHLIAAAPELLQACRHALHKVEQTLAGQYPEGQALDSVVIVLKRAIAIANGE